MYEDDDGINVITNGRCWFKASRVCLDVENHRSQHKHIFPSSLASYCKFECNQIAGATCILLMTTREMSSKQESPSVLKLPKINDWVVVENHSGLGLFFFLKKVRVSQPVGGALGACVMSQRALVSLWWVIRPSTFLFPPSKHAKIQHTGDLLNSVPLCSS